LAVGVRKDDQVFFRGREPSSKRGTIAFVLRMSNQSNGTVRLCDTLDDTRRFVRAPIGDNDDLETFSNHSER
jgi:hypothetical protein